ncbi:MAG: DUF484 family protein [Betaproteobacteria bacterium]
MNATDVAQYLAEHSDFFEQHPEVLAVLQVPHPQNGQAVSLMERQAQMQRERVRALEARLAELVRYGAENDALADKLVAWSAALVAHSDTLTLPSTVLTQIKRVFDVPHATLRLWGIRPLFAQLPCAQPAGEDAMRLAASMAAPYCGPNSGFDAAGWLAEDGATPGSVQSLALLPLRAAAGEAPFGLLVLGSADAERFRAGMGTAFLLRIASLAGAALSRLR